MAFKLYVAQYATTHSIRSTAIHFGIERSTVRHWLRNQANNQLQNRQHTRFRISRNDLGQYSEMEVELFDWIVDQRDRGFCVTGGMIRAQALRILEGTNFQASNGWLTRFLRRKRLVIRRVTTSGRELPFRSTPVLPLKPFCVIARNLKRWIIQIFHNLFNPNSYHENILCIFLINLINFENFLLFSNYFSG